MKKNIIYLFSAFTLLSCKSTIENIKESQEDGDIAILWKGFEHSWEDEVHRVARFGSWVNNSNTDFPRTVKINHAAQAGTNKDKAIYSTKHQVIQVPHTKFISGVEKISILTQEKVVTPFNKRVEIQKSDFDRLDDKNSFEVILSGFDLNKNDFGTKKLGILEVRIENVQHNNNTIVFDLEGELMMNCQSGECISPGKKVDYGLNIHYLIIASKDNEFKSVRHSGINKEYDYDSKINGFLIDDPNFVEPKDTFSLGNPIVADFDIKTKSLGMRGFRFHVSKRSSLLTPDIVPHLYEWKMWLDYPENFDLSSPEAHGVLKFRHVPFGWSNVGHVGHVSITVNPVSLLFKSGVTMDCSWDREIDFGNNNSGITRYKEEKEIKGLLDGNCFN